jgi:hypothetical protein
MPAEDTKYSILRKGPVRRLIGVLTVLVAFLLGAANAQGPPAGGTLTARERDILMLMTARENPNYDLALVMDVSGSMSKVLDQWKERAAKLVDFATPGDNLILIEFDSKPRRPFVKEVREERDKETFKNKVRNVRTTKGYGTDIHAGYLEALRILAALNEARMKSRQPVRLQQVVFVSDGDEVLPDESPFNNPASTDSQDFEMLVRRAEQERRINLIPIGLTLHGYRLPPPKKRVEGQQEKDFSDKVNKDLEDFVKRLVTILNRVPAVASAQDASTFPRSDYQFYINWLSDKVKVEKTSEREGANKRSHIVSFEVKSEFREVALVNLSVDAQYSGTGQGRIVSSPRLTDTRIEPGRTAVVEVEVDFPKNNSFGTKKYAGDVTLTVRGDMEISVLEGEQKPVPGTPPALPTPTASPTPSGKKVTYTFPFNERQAQASITGAVPPAAEFVTLVALGSLSLLGLILFLVLFMLLPIQVTLRTSGKATAFNVSHGSRITLGGGADFLLDGVSDVVAEVRRSLRSFFLVPKKEGVIENFPIGAKEIALRLDTSFSLLVGGTRHDVEFLAGNREYDDAASCGGGASDYSSQGDGSGFTY